MHMLVQSKVHLVQSMHMLVQSKVHLVQGMHMLVLEHGEMNQERSQIFLNCEH
jgi:hypothetical protein